MPDIELSEKITDQPFDFLKSCVEKNIALAYEDGDVNPTMYAFMSGLAELGKHIENYQKAFPKRKYSIYSSYYRPFDNSFEGKIFYFTDDLGLISAYIIGPNLEITKRNPNYTRRVFFGHKLGLNEKNTNIFGCFQDYDYESKNPVGKVDLKKLRSDFLPLPSDIWNRTNKYRSSASDFVFSRGSESNNNLILQNDKRTFYLPFDELVMPEVGERGKIKIYAKPKEDYFDIIISKITQMRKKEMTENWKGKVSYDTFELLEFEFINQEFYNKW